MFETKKELKELQRLLDTSFEKSEGIRYSGFDESHRLSASQLAGFQGARLVAIATVNSSGEPRATPRGAAFLHGKFYLAVNSQSTMVKRLRLHPSLGFTYYENLVLIMGHGAPTPFRKKGPGFKAVSTEWLKAWAGGHKTEWDALEGIDLFLRIDASHLVAFAFHNEQYPESWKRTLPA